MAFEYSEAQYGLRTYGSSVGEVINASATVTATCTIPNVNAVTAVGSGQITGTVTSSTTCSGEVVIIEETDVHSYGMGLYGIHEYTQGDIQTVVTAISSVTASCIRIRVGVATVTVASSISASAVRVPETGATVSGTSTTTVTTTGNGARVRESSATVSPSATIVTLGFKTAKGSATVSAVASVTASGVFMVTGTGALTATATIAAICNRVRFGSGVPTAVASITVLGFATRGGIASTTSLGAYTITYEVGHQDVGGNHKYFITQVQQPTLELVEGNTYVFNYPSAHPFKFSTTSDGTHNSGTEYTTGVTHNSSTQVTIVVPADAPTLYYYCGIHSGMGGTANTPSNLAEAVVTSDSEKIFQGSVVLPVEASITATCERIQRSGGAVSVTSGTATIGREKWEIIVNDSVTWTEIAA
jgi:hypothetical protein